MARKGHVLSQKKAKKKPQAPKDFQKQVNKVGKKKQASSNHTNTDFKVKQMQMPSQQALHDKGEEVTQQGLTLPDLLAHIGHHSAKVREQAFLRLHELCSKNEHLLSTNLARILDASAMAAIDSDAKVRDGFRKFQAWLIEALPNGSLAAFAPTLAIQVRSALSHVSSEVREDGLLLLELYASRITGMQVLSQAESSRIVQTLCQLTAQSDVVLRCLHRLLRPAADLTQNFADATMSDKCGTTSAGQPLVLQMSLQAALAAQLSVSDAMDVGSEEAPSASGSSQGDSPIWEFCLRAWLQAGELPSGGSARAGSTAGRPGWVRLRCAAVLERALEGASVEATTASARSVVTLKPSASQLSVLVGLVKRGEWPVYIDRASPLRSLVDSVNLRMARVLALLSSGEVPHDAPPAHLTRLACAALDFLESFSASVASSTPGSMAATSANLDTDTEDVEILHGAAAVAYAIQALSCLWASAAETSTPQGSGTLHSKHCPALGPEHYTQLVTVTSRFMSGGAEESNEATASAILSVPLAASLLGLRLGSVSVPIPGSLQLGWPSALIMRGDFCFAEVLEGSCPGAAATWVSMWPKLLWYLGKTDPALSTFVLAMLLELAKLASRAGGLHAQLLAGVCPLLLPFLVGRANTEEPPPLAQLPRGLSGAQGLAAAVLPHFTKMTDALITALTRLICQWSDIGLPDADGADKVIGLGVDSCELILEALLGTNSNKDPSPLPTRLRVAITILGASPRQSPISMKHAARAELAALRLADSLAGWLMSRHVHERSEFLPASGLSFDDSRRLALQSLAWPLCMQVLAQAPACASRMLCFLFFCAVRLPNFDTDIDDARSGKPADLAWRTFLPMLLDSFLGEGLSSSGGVALAICTSPLCNAARGNLQRSLATSVESLSIDTAESDMSKLKQASAKCLGQLFVTVWMKSVAATQKPAAYEFLAKLCASKLAGLADTSATEQLLANQGTQIVSVLVAAIACRNELTLSTASWGFEGTDSSARAASSPEALRAEITAQVHRLRIAGQSLDELKAMLPLL